MKIKSIIYILLQCSYITTLAQEEKKDKPELRDFYMDFAVPELTAFSILDIEPTSISKPGNIREFALGITNFVNTKGDLRSGLAIEWAPFKTFNRNTGKWENSKGNATKFEWKNLTFSFATTSDSTNVKLAGALRFAPIDKTNPLNDKQWVDSISSYFNSVTNQRLIQSIVSDSLKKLFLKNVADLFFRINVPAPLWDKFTFLLDAHNNYRMEGLRAKYDSLGIVYDRRMVSEDIFNELKSLFSDNNLIEKFNQNQEELKQYCQDFTDFFYVFHSGSTIQTAFNLHILKMKDDYKKKNWNKWALQVSAGAMYNSEKATINDMEKQIYAFTATTGFPLIGKNWFKGTAFNLFMRDHSQLIMQVKSNIYFTPDSTQNNYLFAGARVLIGNTDKRFSIEIAFIDQSNKLTDLNQSGIRYSIGTEIKLMDNYWLEFAIGGQNFEDKTGVNILPTFAFRHSFGNENRFFK